MSDDKDKKFWQSYIQSQGIVTEVPIRDCIGDKYNDDVRQWRVQQLVANWDWRLFEPPTLSRRANGKYAIIEGRHRLAAAARVLGPEFRVPARILTGLSYEDEAFLAHEMNRLRRRWSAQQKFRSLYEAKRKEAVTLVDTCSRYGFRVRGIDGKGLDCIDPVNTLRHVQDRMGLAVVAKMLKVLRDAWEGRETSSPIMYGVAYLVYIYPLLDLARLTELLKRQAPGKVVREIKGRQTAMKGASETVAALHLIDMYNARLSAAKRLDPALLYAQLRSKSYVPITEEAAARRTA